MSCLTKGTRIFTINLTCTWTWTLDSSFFRFHDSPWLHSEASAPVFVKSTHAKDVSSQQSGREWWCCMHSARDPRLTCWVRNLSYLLFFSIWGAGMAQWWEHLSPTNVVQVRFLDPASYVGSEFVASSCPCSKRFFSGYSKFSPLLKNQHFQIPIRSGKCPQLLLCAKYIIWH